MQSIKFRIFGIPIPKGRPRFFRRGKFVGTYTPKKTRVWENDVMIRARRYRPQYLWEGPLAMKLIFWLPRPKSLSKKVRHHIKKPDLDNITKSIKDALQDVIYKADSQIVMLTLAKHYAACEPGVDVEIDEVGEWDPCGKE